MSGSRLRLLGLAGLLLGALAGLVIASRTWWTIHTDGPPVPMSGTTSSGGLATALALIVAGGMPLLLLLRHRGRQVVAVVQGFAGVGMILTGALPGTPGDELVRTQLRQHTLANATGLETTGWPLGYLVAGLIAVAGAVIVMVGAGRWPTRGDRFDRRTVDATSDDPHEVWKALDAGVDPTAVDGAADDAEPGRSPRLNHPE
ncbi:Trp biosynthesis-associated membrane protein [Enemella sp. A6]|uniref:Trp biosynthesis-associated membrane protein n=1 Tax=Enemella sp. A6 TaxID=3440152 RepID=UPI003EBCBD3C